MLILVLCLQDRFVERKSKASWTCCIGETKTCIVRAHNELESFATTVGRYNRGYGRQRGIFISYTTNWFEYSFTITAHDLNEKDKIRK